MKTLYRISLCINFIVMAFLLIKGGEVAANKWFRLQQNETNAVEFQEDGKEQWSKIKKVDNTDETTSCDTSCHILECNLTDGTEIETISDIPSAYIGKTRKQLIEVLDLYNQSPPLEEIEKGFVDMGLISFSREEITIRKNYETSLYYCCIVVENDYLTVYDENRKKVIMYTDIVLSKLPEDMKQQVIDGKYIKTEQQLYDFLESYSS